MGTLLNQQNQLLFENYIYIKNKRLRTHCHFYNTMVPNIVRENSNECYCIDKTKRAYWNCLAFLVYDRLQQEDSSIIQDNQKLIACLRDALENCKTNAYWLWHDLLDVLDFVAPENQDWIDDISPEDEENEIMKNILYPDVFDETCWYWIDLIVNGQDEVDR